MQQQENESNFTIAKVTKNTNTKKGSPLAYFCAFSTVALMYYDAHMHLNDPKMIADRQYHVDAFLAIGGKGLIIVGTDQKSNEEAITLVQKIEKTYGSALFCKATVGIHPAEIAYGIIKNDQDLATAIASLQALYIDQQAHIVALGECGLDAHYPGYEQTQALQKRLFTAQITLAQTYTVPLVVHSRDDFLGTKQIMQQASDIKRYLHCWSYGPNEISELQAIFPHLRIGRCGNTTYPKAIALRESLAMYMQNNSQANFLLETDAPYLTPQSKRGESNTSANLPELYTTASTVLQRSLDDVQKHVQRSFFSLYGNTP